MKEEGQAEALWPDPGALCLRPLPALDAGTNIPGLGAGSPKFRDIPTSCSSVLWARGVHFPACKART